LTLKDIKMSRAKIAITQEKLYRLEKSRLELEEDFRTIKYSKLC
jgi:hypothetical protein